MIKQFIILTMSLLMLASCSEKSQSNMIQGYEYIIHEEGSGPEVQPGQYVSFTMSIQDDQGKVFQENMTEPYPAIKIPDEGEPAPAGQGSQIIDLMSLSKVGDSISMIIPRDSLKGALPPGNDSLVHMAYVFKIKKTQEAADYEAALEERRQAEAAQAELLKSRELEVKDFVASVNKDIKSGKANVQSLDNGLKYIIHEEGTGAQPSDGDNVKVLYYGTLEDGTMFDNAFSRGKEFEFTIGKGMVIKGWDLGIPLLKEGGKATLIIPSDLGYGDQGAGASIPGGSTLHFYVELVEVN